MRVLITGGAAGLPQGIALVLAARDGHDVAITYRAAGTPPDKTLQLIAATGRHADAYPVDFAGDEADIERSLTAAVATPVQALVHGVGPMTVRRFARTTLRDYHDMVDGNLRSAVLAAHAVLPAMRERGFGRLVFFALTGSAAATPVRGLALHAAAKAALVAFARTLAAEEGRHGITVNVIAPGDIRDKTLTREQALQRSANNPRGRPGTYEDVADAVRFLLDPAHDFVNGSVLSVSGGLLEPYETQA